MIDKTQPSDKSLRYDQLQRFKFIETLAQWEGELSTKHLCDYFGIQRQQASRDIKTYLLEIGPGNLIYDGSLKRYVVSDKFEAQLIDDKLSDYLVTLKQRHSVASSRELTRIKPLYLGEDVVHEINFGHQPISATLFRQVLNACVHAHCLNIDHRTIKSPTSELQTIAPHSIIFVDKHWFVRAYCFRDLTFKNFELRHIFGEPTYCNEQHVNTVEMDDDWNTLVNINLIPDPRLSAVQKLIVEREYKMEFGSLLINIRVCLIPYLLKQLNIDVNVTHPDPTEQKIVIENLNAIKRWVF